jgi:c-di-GMP-binding flagellar brake protein YcgR
MRIQIGAELSVNMEGHNPFTAIYVGAKDKKHIVLAITEGSSGLLKGLKDPEKITVQYSYNGVRYEFRATILNVLDEPIHLAVLEYPAEIIEVDKRSAHRINCLISAKLDAGPEKDVSPILGVIENINKTGCLCILKEKECVQASMSKGDRVNITCQFPGLIGEQTADGRVVRIRKDKGDTVIGIHFDDKIWWVPPYERK